MSIADTPITPFGPTPRELTGLDPALDSIHGVVNIRRDDSPTFSILNKRLNAAHISWKGLRDVLAVAFLTSARDQQLLTKIKELSLQYIPVRSGRLADTFFNTMTIVRRSRYAARYVYAFGTEWSPLRPRPIKGNVAKLGKGYGEHYIPTHSIPNRHFLYSTLGGNALYVLDDPAALNDPIPKIMDIAEDIIFEDFHDAWHNTLITLHIN